MKRIISFITSLLVISCVSTVPVISHESDHEYVTRVLTRDHPEVVLLDGQLRCSGALLAPRVVITAAHCIFNSNTFEITAPLVGNKKAHATDAIVFNDLIDGCENDIGLLLLDTPIYIDNYPKPERTNEEHPKVRVLGRSINLMEFTTTPVHNIYFRSNTCYYTTKLVSYGDSGGPVELADHPHHIIAIVTHIINGDNKMGIYTSVDVVLDWLLSSKVLNLQSPTLKEHF